MVSEPVREIEPVIVLKSERCSPRVETEPRVADSPCEKPLTSEAVMDNEPVSVLNRAVLSTMVDDSPSVVANVSL